MFGFDQWKKGFDQWEQATAKVFEEWLKSPLVLEPSGAMLTMAMKLKKASDEAMQQWWGAMGLPTKRTQDRTLHELQRLQSRIIDLEELLESTRDELAAARSSRASAPAEAAATATGAAAPSDEVPPRSARPSIPDASSDE